MSLDTEKIVNVSVAMIITEQANKINKLEAQLKEANEVIGFYDCHRSTGTVPAFKSSDDVSDYLGEVPRDDFELLQEGSDSCNMFMGKRAREYLDRHKIAE